MKLKFSINFIPSNDTSKNRLFKMRHIQIDPKIRLESVQLSHASIIFDAIDHDRSFLGEWLPFVNATQKISDTEAFIKSLLMQQDPKRDDVFIIWYKEAFAGLIGFKDTDWVNRKTEIGYWLTEKMQGKGIVTKCIQQLVRYAFHTLHLNRIQIKVAQGNTKSAAIPQRLGFYHEGTERQGERMGNRYFDLDVFSLIRADWPTHVENRRL